MKYRRIELCLKREGEPWAAWFNHYYANSSLFSIDVSGVAADKW